MDSSGPRESDSRHTATCLGLSDLSTELLFRESLRCAPPVQIGDVLSLAPNHGSASTNEANCGCSAGFLFAQFAVEQHDETFRVLTHLLTKATPGRIH